jgi:hypothetical protein
MLADDPPVLADHDAIRISMNLDPTTDRTGRHQVICCCRSVPSRSSRRMPAPRGIHRTYPQSIVRASAVAGRSARTRTPSHLTGPQGAAVPCTFSLIVLILIEYSRRIRPIVSTVASASPLARIRASSASAPTFGRSNLDADPPTVKIARRMTVRHVDRLAYLTRQFDEGVEGHERVLLGLGHPDLPGEPAWLSIAGSSAACPGRWRSCAPSNAGRRSSATLLRSPARSRVRRGRPRASVPSKAHIASGRGGAPSRIVYFAHAVGEADELLLTLGGGADDKQALRGVLEASLQVDAVDPEVDVLLG